MHIDLLKTKEPFRSLFPIDANVLNAIVTDMKENGFDKSQPIGIWKGSVIDGHTRLLAAGKADIKDVPVYEHYFVDEERALEYAIHCQTDRRNLTDADILRCVEALDHRKTAGRPKSDDKLAQGCANYSKSASTTADLIGISTRKTEQARTILNHANDEIKQAVLSGEKSINRAYNDTQEMRREQETFSAMEKVIDSYVKSCVEVGKALIRIRDGKLYKGHARSFKEFCMQRWDMDTEDINQYIEMARSRMKAYSHE